MSAEGPVRPGDLVSSLPVGYPMTQDEIQELEREANGLYQAGEYHRAREVWLRILESDPENSRAAEGVRMASLLSENWDFFGQEGDGEEIPLQSGLDRAQAMSRGGDFEGALHILQELEAEFPEAEALVQARQEVQHAYEMAPFVGEQLRLAQERLDAGDLEEAGAACAKVIALDPTNRRAREMREQIEHGRGSGGSGETEPAEASAGRRAKEPWPPADLEIADESLARAESEAPAEESATTGGDLPELELLELEEADEIADGALPSSRPSLAEPTGSRGKELDLGPGAALGAEPEGVSEPSASEGWSLETPEAREDQRNEAPGPLEPPGEGLPGLAVPEGLENGDAERFVALVEEGHRALDEARYQDAIELLSHALAMDESHEGATRLLDRARREQAESYRVAEAKLMEGIDLFESGLLDEAEPLLRQVLDAIPDHHAARDYLAQVASARASAPPSGVQAETGALGHDEPHEEPLDLPDLRSAETGGDLTGISPGEVVLDEGGAEVGLAGPSAGELLTDSEEAAGAEAVAELDDLGDFSDLGGEVTEASPRPSRSPWMIVVVLLLVGGGVAGWLYRDEIRGFFDKGGEEAVLSHEERAALAPPGEREDKTEAQLLEMIEEAGNGSAQAEPEAAGAEAAAVKPSRLRLSDLGRLLDDARADVRAGRGREALATVKTILELDEGNSEIVAIQKPARLIVTAREGFEGREYEESLRALYRLDSQVEASLRPVAVSRWLDNTRWNFLLGQLEDEQPWRVLELTHPSRGELQLRGADRDAVRPLIEMARRWQYESARELRRSGYHDELKAFSYRSFDE